MRSRTEPFIRRDQYAARAPANGSTRYGMAMNWNLVLSKGNQMSTQWNPKNTRQAAAPGNHTFLICKSMEGLPLGVGQVHAVEYDGDPTDVSGGFRIYETASSLQISLVASPRFGPVAVQQDHPHVQEPSPRCLHDSGRNPRTPEDWRRQFAAKLSELKPLAQKSRAINNLA